MTTNQTIDGVPRELLDKALLDAHRVRFATDKQVIELRALLDAPEPTVFGCNRCGFTQAEWTAKCVHCHPAAQPQPDPVLCKFYDVTDWPGLVRELVGHVAQLQDSAKRNVKPWEDTFPPTLLPAYVERVNAESAEVLASQLTDYSVTGT